MMHRSLPLHGAPPETASPSPLPLARKGFRPFFLLAAAFASAIVPLWLLVLAGSLRLPAVLDPVTLHAHEMVFGYVVAVVAGFLLTAVGNWTGRETVVGGRLLGLAAVWASGRVVMLSPLANARLFTAVVDLAFLPLLMLAIARPLLAARSRRNYVMLGVLGALFAANLAVHLEALGVAAPGTGRHALQVAVDVVVLLCVVVAGRVVPMFTRNATGVEGIAAIPTLDRVAAAAVAALVVVDVVAPASYVALVLAALAGGATAARAARWGTRHTLRTPLLWILHAGSAWISIGLVLRASPLVGVYLMPSLALHALTLGGIGALTLGMMARVALGHTGRALEPPKAIGLSFGLLTLAALVRVLAPIVAPHEYLLALAVSGVAWTGAFVIFLVHYTPVLAAPRVDGKPG